MHGSTRRGNERNWLFYAMPLAFFILVLAPMLGVTVAVDKVAKPATCASCHGGDRLGGRVTKGPVQTQATAHYGLPCVSCHRDPKVITSALLGKAWAFEDNAKKTGGGAAQGAKKTQQSSQPAQGARSAQGTPGVKTLAAGTQGKGTVLDVSDSACTACHKFTSDKPKEGTMHIAAHKTHAQKGVRCTQCHISSIHGKASEDGKKIEYPKPKEDTCLACHRTLQKVGVWPPKLMACSSCHVAQLKPGFHEPREVWLKDHGPQALSMGPAMCAGCHNKQRIDDKLDDMKDARTFARNSFWCSGCHMNNRPARHNDIWRIIHKTQALANFDYCNVCHNPNKPDVKKLSTDLEERAVQKIWCNRCHNPPDKSKHPPASDWLPRHYQYVQSKGPVQGNCFNCHLTNHCQVCHNSATAKVLIEKFRADMRARGEEPPPPPPGIPGLTPPAASTATGGAKSGG